MKGHLTVKLGEDIIAARAALNETTAIQGTDHPSTVQAARELAALQAAGTQLFA